jgi:hypothetical protein
MDTPREEKEEEEEEEEDCADTDRLWTQPFSFFHFPSYC